MGFVGKFDQFEPLNVHGIHVDGFFENGVKLFQSDRDIDVFAAKKGSVKFDKQVFSIDALVSIIIVNMEQIELPDILPGSFDDIIVQIFPAIL